MANEDFIIENGELKEYCGAGGNVVIPEGVTSIGEEAFSGCHKLSVPELPAGLVSKGARIFTEVSTYY